MKFKKIASFCLSAMIGFSSTNIIAYNSAAVDENNEIKSVYVSCNINGTSKRLPAILNEKGDILFSRELLSDITVYQYDADRNAFRYDNVESEKEYREIWMLNDSKEAHIVTLDMNLPVIQKVVKLSNVVEYEDETYYPISEMLPLLNADAAIEDGILYICNPDYSLTNIINNFEINDYLFDLYDSDGKLLEAYSYLFTTLLNFEWKRLISINGFNHGKCEDYEEIFTSYLGEDTVYLASMEDTDHYYLPLVQYLKSEDYEEHKFLQGGLKIVNDAAEKIHDSEIEKYPTLDSYDSSYSKIFALNTLSELEQNILKLYSYAALYVDHVDDHYQMLDVVFDLTEDDKYRLEVMLNIDEPVKAAYNVHKMYGEDVNKSIFNFVMEQAEEKILDDAVSLELLTFPKIAASLTKLYFDSYDFYVYEVADKCQNLGYYNKIMERSCLKYAALRYGASDISVETIEKTRLSAILALLSSRSSYQALLDSDKALGNSGGVYQRKIDKINEMLKKLYLAKNCCCTDSSEYIDEKSKELKESIKNVNIYDNNEITEPISLDKQTEGIDKESLELYAKYFYLHYDENDCNVYLADFTHDGNKEMIVVTNVNKGMKGEVSNIIVHGLKNDNVETLYKTYTGGAHVGDQGVSWIRIDNKDYLYQYNRYQNCGIGAYKSKVIFIDETGNEIIYDDANIKEFYIKGGIAPENYDAEFEKEQTEIWLNHLSIYMPNSITLSNDTLSVTVTDYPNVSENRFTSSPASVIFSNIDLSIDSNLLGTTCVGVVITENTGLNLRKHHSSESEIICEIPKNSKITYLSSAKLNDNDWYLVDWNGKIGYVKSDYISLTNEKVTLSNEDVIAIAQMLYLYGAWVTDFQYSDLFITNGTDIFTDQGNEFILLENIKSQNDMIDTIHTLFSKKYDGFYNYSKVLDETDFYRELNGKWYMSRFIHQRGNLPLTYLDGNEHYALNLLVKEINGNEVWFSGVIQWTKTDQTGYGYASTLPDKSISDFSIIYEDNTWKCGKINFDYDF